MNRQVESKFGADRRDLVGRRLVPRNQRGRIAGRECGIENTTSATIVSTGSVARMRRMV